MSSLNHSPIDRYMKYIYGEYYMDFIIVKSLTNQLYISKDLSDTAKCSYILVTPLGTTKKAIFMAEDLSYVTDQVFNFLAKHPEYLV